MARMTLPGVPGTEAEEAAEHEEIAQAYAECQAKAIEDAGGEEAFRKVLGPKAREGLVARHVLTDIMVAGISLSRDTTGNLRLVRRLNMMSGHMTNDRSLR